jgi:hypothetical protein
MLANDACLRDNARSGWKLFTLRTKEARVDPLALDGAPMAQDDVVASAVREADENNSEQFRVNLSLNS